MRYIRYGILAVIGVSLITVALANRGSVTLQLLPGHLGAKAPSRCQSVRTTYFSNLLG